MNLYRKYRPKNLDKFVGNKSTVKALQSVLKKDSKPHAFLFVGPSGCGKTTLARIVRREVGCSERDFIEVDAADFRGIDTIREIRKQMNLGAMRGEVRVWLLDECHMMTKDAQNALLKALEDTPSHVYFILATTEPNKLLATIKSRCSVFNVAPLGEKELLHFLKKISRKERKKVPVNVLEKIYDVTGGAVRSSLVLLEKVIDLPVEQMEEAISEVDEDIDAIELCRALLKGKSWKVISPILKKLKGQDPEQIRRLILSYMSSVLLNQGNNKAAAIIECFSEDYFSTGFAGLVFSCFDATQNT